MASRSRWLRKAAMILHWGFAVLQITGAVWIFCVATLGQPVSWIGKLGGNELGVSTWEMQPLFCYARRVANRTKLPKPRILFDGGAIAVTRSTEGPRDPVPQAEYWVRYEFYIPPTTAFAAVMVYPAVSVGLLLFRLGKRSGRRSANCCATCGYNLTGNTSGVCPECASPVISGRQ